MPFGRPWDSWIAQYAESHQHPVNRATHTIGIPMIAVSVPLLLLAPFVPAVLWPAVGLFTVGWALQFVGHAFEGKRPEFLNDPRFLLVGLRWWAAKVRGRA
jgi:uncharacterized membrane protein YGL010W